MILHRASFLPVDDRPRGGRLATKDETPPALCISIHDVAPCNLDACRRLRDMVTAIGALPVTLLVTPRHHLGATARDEARMTGWLDRRRDAGDELALHGWTHLDAGPPASGAVERLLRHVYCDGEAEFAAVRADEARVRLMRGIEWFHRRDWPVHGFVPPAWITNAATRAVLREFGFRYTTSLSRVEVLLAGRAFASHPVVYSTRTAWRRRASLAWNAMLLRRAAGQPLLRIALHPGDVGDPSIRRQVTAAIERAAGWRPAMTKNDFAQIVTGTNARAARPASATSAPTTAPASTSLG